MHSDAANGTSTIAQCATKLVIPVPPGARSGVVVALLGTLDTKGAEYAFLRDSLVGLGVETLPHATCASLSDALQSLG